ncbi:MAG: acyl-CoA desaturase [Candidatus Niyogibacteria bacterium CG10_big_fil_rev_8_21_14_0_10_46_36]|uniref:Acyl-CoA desaturase n=1 Tax=Candidatus Niyogibacteria bacterium CG10_big_fil_rev_8_21_14_0_10_46_36 TaxID=1974726 RepID=A0A2H0TDW1_9BACT|nr:MAG: acyl-CoA desaturase [Candidatus Niyogibacteria bacterium CG10_big_fil_rev_8_21_14_0_10_46_36]
MRIGDNITFEKKAEFSRELTQNVEDYFKRTGEKKRDHPLMFLKAAFMLAWFGGAYYLLVFTTHTWIEAILYTLLLSFAAIGIGFNVQHDANHGALSSRKWVNYIFGYTLDIIGGSSFFWRKSHNIAHHTYTNIQGEDDDIDFGILARMAPDQPRRRMHAYQHIYLWFLYGLIFFRWHFDFKAFKRSLLPSSNGTHINLMDRVMFWAGKIIFWNLAFIIPMLYHSWWTVLACYAFGIFSIGFVAAIIFSLAHSMNETEHPLPNPETLRIPSEWMVHQLKTTVNFSPNNPFLTFYLGGLNYQVEHHLFHRISHIHYPRIAPIVEKTCKKFGIRYRVNKTFWSAIHSHYLFLKRMGQSRHMTSH